MTDIQEELKALEAKQVELERKKADLLKLQQEMAERNAKLDALVQTSGFGSPRELVDALIEKFNLRMKTGSGRKASSGKRRRTLVTPQLRDAMKADLASGMRKSQVAKKHQLSYLVVVKVEQGKYDHLS